MSKRDDDGDDRKKKGSSFLGRWFKRLLLLGLAGGAALSYGFYQRKGPDGQPQKKLPWQDVDGFKAYAVDWYTFTEKKTTEYAAQAKERWDKEWSKDAEALYEKAAKYVQGAQEGSPEGASTGASTSAAATAGQQPAGGAGPAGLKAGAAPSGPAATPAPPPPPAPASSAGYNAYKDAKQAFVDGCAHFRKAKTAGRPELVIANQKFGDAMAGCSKAEELGFNDPHLSDLANDVAQFRKECRTLLERTK
jgi:hypothetical protein